MHIRYKAIVIEHGGGTNKHLFYVWELSKHSRIGNSGRFDWYRQLVSSGVRTTLDDCYDAIKEFNQDMEKPIRVETIYS